VAVGNDKLAKGKGQLARARFVTKGRVKIKDKREKIKGPGFDFRAVGKIVGKGQGAVGKGKVCS
jgi:hypothetical protein